MNKTLPNKWVRKAIFDSINDIEVANENVVLNGNLDNLGNGQGNGINGNTFQAITVPCYDVRVTANGGGNYYTLLTTQTNLETNPTKCESVWQSSILIDIVTIFNGAGNTGSRDLVDNITDAIRNATDNLTLDVSSGLKIQKQTLASIDSLDNITPTQNVFRNLYRIELTIN